MRRRFAGIILFTVILAGCGSNETDDTVVRQDVPVKEESVLPDNPEEQVPEETEASAVSESLMEQDTEDEHAETDIAEQENGIMEEGQENMIRIQVGNKVMSAKLSENVSVDALKELLAEEPLTIEMSDYGNFEKVGSIGEALASDDEQITASPGDIMLYSSRQIVIFYGSNSWA